VKGKDYNEKIQREASFHLNYRKGQEINGLRSWEIVLHSCTCRLMLGIKEPVMLTSDVKQRSRDNRP